MTDESESESEMRLRMAQQMTAAIPHSAALNMRVDGIGEGWMLMSVPYDERFVGNPKTGVLHGGVITALLDGTSGAAVMTHPKAPGGTATIDLRIDYMRSAEPGKRVYARATCYRITRNVAFVRAVAFDTDEDNPVATANGAFTVEARGRKIGQPA